MDTLYLNNDMTIEMQNVRFGDSASTSGVTIEATLYGMNDEVVGGMSWPVEFEEIAPKACQNRFVATLSSDLEVEDRGRYKLKIVATKEGGQRYEVWRTVRAFTRYA